MNRFGLRTVASRRDERVAGAKAIVWKMPRMAAQTWRKRNAQDSLPLAASGVTFQDGVGKGVKAKHSEESQARVVAA